MERAISVDERIKRAEQRYYNTIKNDNNINKESKTRTEDSVKKEHTKNKKNTTKKLLIEIITCLAIYAIFYGVTKNESLLSKDMKNKTQEILNTDINLFQVYSNIKVNIEKCFNNIKSKKIINNENGNSNEEEKIDNIQNNNENIGGAVEDIDLQIGETSEIEELEQKDDGENVTNAEDNEKEEKENEEIELSQMEKDANFIKENISIIKPVNGTISSRYGLRNPTTITVPKNHTGIDLAAIVGTKIVSATDGIVVLNSSKGDYGKHLKIQNGDITFIYAHCNKLYVNEGDEVQQGQEIAEVGTTGNVTGPHLHFEIRYQNRLIDPELILEF